MKNKVVINNAISQKTTEIERLDREMVDLLIDKVLVYGEKDIEIVWLDNFGSKNKHKFPLPPT
jgi:hypothetical protein